MNSLRHKKWLFAEAAVLVFLFGLLIPFAAKARLTPEDVIAKIKLSKASWKVDTSEKTKSNELNLAGQSASIRIQVYEYPKSALHFLESVKGILIQNPAYQNSEWDPVVEDKLEGKSWAHYALKRKDGIRQALWALKIESYVLHVIYTAMRQDYDREYSDLAGLLHQISKIKGE